MRILQYEGVSSLSEKIQFFTWNRTTHSAVETGSGMVIEAWKGAGQDGVRLVGSLHEQHTPGTVVRAYRVPGLTEPLEEELYAWLLTQQGKPYAFWDGVMRFVARKDPMPYDPQSFRVEEYDPSGWFCSCLVFAGFARVGLPLLERIPPWRVSPGHINFSPRLVLDEVITVDAAQSAIKQRRKG